MKKSNELYVNVNMDGFPLKKPDYACCQQYVLYRYKESIAFAGKSGFDRKFDFVVHKLRNSPERLMKVINDLNKNTIDSLIYGLDRYKKK
jgi:hypothetical protein